MMDEVEVTLCADQWRCTTLNCEMFLLLFVYTECGTLTHQHYMTVLCVTTCFLKEVNPTEIQLYYILTGNTFLLFINVMLQEIDWWFSEVIVEQTRAALLSEHNQWLRSFPNRVLNIGTEKLNQKQTEGKGCKRKKNYYTDFLIIYRYLFIYLFFKG